MINFLLLFINLSLFSPEIYNFGDSVKIVIRKKGNLASIQKKVEDGHFKLILPFTQIPPPYSYKIQTDYVLGFEIYKSIQNLVFDFKFTSIAEKYRIVKRKNSVEVTFIKKRYKETKRKQLLKEEHQEEPLEEEVYQPTPQLTEPSLEKKERKIKKIVIDPGHGGRDSGAVGRKGTKEKDINLQVAKILKQMIEKELGLQVILTRERDTFISLKERSVIANMEKADLFISLHCNASRKLTSKGVEVYFLSEAKTDWERAVEALENASLKFELPEKEAQNVLDAILLDLAQTEFLKESQKLAECLQKKLVNNSIEIDRGVKQAGFYVLYGVYMPAVLIELGFITNPKEEKLLKNKKYQKKMCARIVRGIREFIKWYE